jgi:predicted MFS family arabinose efflux permease
MEAQAVAAKTAPLYWLALGAFAVGTEGFMIAAILPRISADLGVSISAAGQLVTIFALAYAFSSPLLTTLTGSVARRTLLIASMAAFAGANLMAALAPGYWFLATARVLLALSAGLFVPSANALAGALVPPAHRARAIATVNGGITMAIALGVPLGAVVGTRFGWRMTFVGVALLSTFAVIGLVKGLPQGVGNGMTSATLRERLDVVRMPGIAVTLLTTTLWAAGGYTVYTYIAPFLYASTAIRGSQIGFVLFAWGASAGVGLFIGGSATDKLGPARVIGTALPSLAIALASLSLSAHYLAPSFALVPILLGIVIWGVSAWSFYPAQQMRLIGMTGLKVAPIILSLNASFMYIGFSLGAALGSLTLVDATASNLGFVGAVSEVIALGLFASARYRTAQRAVAVTV